MTAANENSRIALVLMQIRAGYGVEDISVRHKIPVAEVRLIVADLRRGGYLPGGKREQDRPPRKPRVTTAVQRNTPKPANLGRFEPTRADDDRLLEEIALRIKGRTASEVGRMLGRNPQTVRQGTVAVMNADLAESGEPAGAVLKHYWAARS